MFKISECIDVYEKLMRFKYTYTLDDGTVISFKFADLHFHHLIGLHKLVDIPQLQKEKGKRSAAVIYKHLRDTPKEHTDYDSIIPKSSFYSSIIDRIAYFDLIPDLLSDCKVIVDFDYKKVKNFKTELKGTKYILYKRLDDDKILHLTLCATNNNVIMPETFFMHSGKEYLDNQDLRGITNYYFEKVNKKKTKK